MNEKIINLIKNNKKVCIVGGGDVGKTHYVINELMPCLKKSGFKAQYFSDADEISKIKSNTKVAIIDEFETFVDKQYLENKYPKDKPYYSQEYINKVKKWHTELSGIGVPCVYVITRKKEDVDNLASVLNKLDWNEPTGCLRYSGCSHSK